jgi:thiosulfate/3-mercaptopyruvate sulfurtransferase
MSWQTLIDADALRRELGDPRWVVLDARFDLADPDSGERAWRAGHVPGAQYAHLDRDLSDLSRRGMGRHPLPDAEVFCATLARWGITPEHQIVAYDAGNGMFAARLWWMMRALGHRDVAVLDGGLAAWQAAGHALSTTHEEPARGRYQAQFDPRQIVTVDDVSRALPAGEISLLDARAAERFRGEVEPLDPRAGHVPGARNRPFAANLAADGRFLPKDVLAAQFGALLGARPAQALVHMCGSGVTACHNLLAMEHAGFHGARLYAGSWSQWCGDPTRAIATGEA